MKKTYKRLISILVIISFIGIYISPIVKPQCAFAETEQEKRDRIEREASGARWGLMLVGLAAVIWILNGAGKKSFEEPNTILHKFSIKLVQPIGIHENYFYPNTTSTELPIPMMKVTLVKW